MVSGHQVPVLWSLFNLCCWLPFPYTLTQEACQDQGKKGSVFPHSLPALIELALVREIPALLNGQSTWLGSEGNSE